MLKSVSEISIFCSKHKNVVKYTYFTYFIRRFNRYPRKAIDFVKPIGFNFKRKPLFIACYCFDFDITNNNLLLW